jgi:pimeloyl-ACP methyl ester carboxylesterase
MDLVLRWVRGLASRPLRAGPVRGRFRELVRLTNPEVTELARAHRVLGAAEAESARVLLDLARLARAERPEIDGVDLLDAVHRAAVPVAAVIGGRDVFCGPRCVEPLRNGVGPRRIVALAEHAHVDLTLGNSAALVLDELYPFLLA